jgi:hypothetical protein
MSNPDPRLVALCQHLAENNDLRREIEQLNGSVDSVEYHLEQVKKARLALHKRDIQRRLLELLREYERDPRTAREKNADLIIRVFRLRLDVLKEQNDILEDALSIRERAHAPETVRDVLAPLLPDILNPELWPSRRVGSLVFVDLVGSVDLARARRELNPGDAHHTLRDEIHTLYEEACISVGGSPEENCAVPREAGGDGTAYAFRDAPVAFGFARDIRDRAARRNRWLDPQVHFRFHVAVVTGELYRARRGARSEWAGDVFDFGGRLFGEKKALCSPDTIAVDERTFAALGLATPADGWSGPHDVELRNFGRTPIYRFFTTPESSERDGNRGEPPRNEEEGGGSAPPGRGAGGAADLLAEIEAALGSEDQSETVPPAPSLGDSGAAGRSE